MDGKLSIFSPVSDALYDIAVIGAGPSGGYFAYLAAKQGHRVLLCDRAEFPREKTCGGGLSQKTIDLLEFDVADVVERRIRGAWLTYRNRDTVVKDLGERSGIAVLRSRFDALIVERAQSAGAEFRSSCAFVGARRTGDLVDIATSRGSVRARYIVAADGVFSQVRTHFFGTGVTAYAPAVEAWIYVPPRVIEAFEDRVVFDFGGMPRGYGWIFPKKDHLNVGVFSIFTTQEINDHLRAFIALYPGLGEPTDIKFRGYAIPLRNRKGLYQDGNVWLLGDAAGFAESFYGEGIYFGLKSATIAAAAMREAFDRPRDMAYTRRLQQEMLTELHYSALNARLFFSFQKLGFYRMVRNPYVNRQFAELIAGGVGHRECFYRTLASLPWWVTSSRSLPVAHTTF
ncbi:MAG TPA: geranylgeranyl reductase family protein [Bacteroidota bacterium]|nr:geranylgeranyl reductase family protein [Bacteroidota bacterium]